MDTWNDIKDHETSDPETLLRQLQSAAMTDVSKFQSSTYHDSMRKILDAPDLDNATWNLLAHGPSYCHIAQLPSETRRKGIVLEGGMLDLFSRETEAVAREEADTTYNTSTAQAIRGCR
jgi:hypothetical protein